MILKILFFKGKLSLQRKKQHSTYLWPICIQELEKLGWPRLQNQIYLNAGAQKKKLFRQI